MKRNKLFNSLIATATLTGIFTAGFPKVALSATNILNVCKESNASDSDYIVYLANGDRTLRIATPKDINGFNRQRVKEILKSDHSYSDSAANTVKNNLEPYDRTTGTPICYTSSSSSSSNGVQGIELRYFDSAFQCGSDTRQANIKVDVYSRQNYTKLATLSRADSEDTFTTTEVDSINDLDFVYKVYDFTHCSGFTQGMVRNVGGSMVLGSDDTIPSVGGFEAQASISEMLTGLEDSYEKLLLVELGGSDTSSSSYDLQDVVLVVDNNPDSLVDNAAPIAQPDTITTDEDNSTTYNLIAGDPNNSNAGRDSDPEGDTLYVTKFNLNGTEYTLDTTTNSRTVTMLSGAELTVNRNGDIEYDPNGQFEALNAGESASTPDRFTYTVADSEGSTSTATATVNVNGAADDPVAVDDTFRMDEDTSRRIHVLQNDSDPNSNTETLRVIKVNNTPIGLNETYTLQSGAILTIKEVADVNKAQNGDYTLEYDPTQSSTLNLLNEGQNATDTFTYTVSDPEGNTGQGNVEVTVEGITDTYAD